MRELIVITHVPTDSVNEGFIPAAKALGLVVVLLTDSPQLHRQHFAQGGLTAYPDEIIACDVFNPLALIDVITHRKQRPAGIFSNSDHLQSSTSIAAQYFGVAGKDWRTTYRAKNKAEMRAHLASLGIDTLWHAVVCSSEELLAIREQAPFPCVVKPREGVASQQVSLARDPAELRAQCTDIWAAHPGQALLLEEYIDGPLYTLETLGDGRDVVALGGFQVKLSPPPYFVEMEAIWGTDLSAQSEALVTDIIRRFGIGFGACHTEYVITDRGPRLIEINYRNIGDYREFLLRDTLQIPLFEIVLRTYLGEPLPSLALSSNAAWIRYFTATSAGKLRGAPDAFTLRDEAFHLTYKPLRKIGDTIQTTNSNKDYLGVLRGAGRSREQLAAAICKTSNDLAWEIA
jgi:biotin carboxylase